MDGKAGQKEDHSPDSDAAELKSNNTNQQQARKSSTYSHPADDDRQQDEEDSDVLVQRLLAQHEQNPKGPPCNEGSPRDTTTTSSTSQSGGDNASPPSAEEELVQQLLAQHEQNAQGPSSNVETPTAGGDVSFSSAGDDDDDDVPSTGENFTEGEEGPPEFTRPAAEPASHEGSLVLEDDGTDDDGSPGRDLSTPKRESAGGGSPDDDDDDDDDGTEESEANATAPDDAVDNMVAYGEYLELYQRLQAERESLIQHNGQLQTKLLEYFHRQTGDSVHPEKQKRALDQEWPYQAEMGVLDELKRQHVRDSERTHQQAEELRQQAQDKLDRVETEWQALAALTQEVAAGALRRRLGRQAACAEAERMLASERHRDIQLTQARLRYIKLRNGVHRLEAACGARGELPDGVEPLFFQQLKFENQKLLEKIEQRNEELLKLQRKIANYVGVLAHMKEKIHYSQTDNRANRTRLSQLEALASRRRDELTRLKQARDRARARGQRLKRRCGLLGKGLLLRDFEDKVDGSLRLERDIESLRMHRHTLELEHCSKTKKTRQKEKEQGADAGYRPSLDYS